MRATTMDYPLTLATILERAERVSADVAVVSRRPDGALHRTSHGEMAARALRLAAALEGLGLNRGDRVASLMWNSHGHLEAYFGVPAAGGVLHTANPRMGPHDIADTLADAGDRFLIVDDVLLDLAAEVVRRAPVERVIVFPLSGAARGRSGEYLDYEALLAAAPARPAAPPPGEHDPATICFTGGTTGRPKGVVYSHRALMLHAFGEAMKDGFGYGRGDVVLPAVPMFHVNGWGIPFSATMVGAKLVLTGPRVDAGTILGLCEGEGVTFMAGVPTVWTDLLRALDAAPGRFRLVPGLEIVTGGSAPHESLVRGLHRHGIVVRQGWGLTESAGIMAVSRVPPGEAAPGSDAWFAGLLAQGRPLPIATLRVVGEDGAVLPADGRSAGTVEARGASVTAGYLGGRGGDRFTPDGWFRTGDVGTIGPDGTVRVLDRTEDLVKSGGEWIVPLVLEDAILAFPGVRECAVIAADDARFGERPVAVVVTAPDVTMEREALAAFLRDRFPGWWLPDAVVAVDAIPRTGVGKIARKRLRDAYRGILGGPAAPAGGVPRPDENEGTDP